MWRPCRPTLAEPGRSIPVWRQVRRVDDSITWRAKPCDRRHVGGAQSEVEDPGIVGNSLDILPARERDDARLLYQPTQDHLGHTPTISRGNVLEQVGPEDTADGHPAIRHQTRLTGGNLLQQRGLIEKWVVLDLVGHERVFEKRGRGAHHVGTVVTYA